MTHKVLLLAGDGIGPEIMQQGQAALQAVTPFLSKGIEFETALIGGCAVDAAGDPLPATTLDLARKADAILMGAVGGPAWDQHPRPKRPEQGLLRIRSELGLFANLRPAILYPELVEASTLRKEVVENLDILIVRELTGGLYFGTPRGIKKEENGQRMGYNTMLYRESEIQRIAKVAFEIAEKRNKRLCSVDKANVLEVSELWRAVLNEQSAKHPAIQLTHLYVDNAAMQLVRAPKQFDVVVTENLFGDILSDCAAMLTGSIGMLPSASLNEEQFGLYEPVHGSAPDLAGKNKANPLALILSAAMMLRYSLNEAAGADAMEAAVRGVLAKGLRTTDLADPRAQTVGTQEMGQAVCQQIRQASHS